MTPSLRTENPTTPAPPGADVSGVGSSGADVAGSEVARLADFVARARFEDLSSQAVEQLKIRVLDTLGVAFGALDAEPMVAVRYLVADLGVDLPAMGGPILAPGLGAQGATAEDVRSVFAGALPQVLASSSRDVLRAGPDVTSLRERARAVATEVAAITAA